MNFKSGVLAAGFLIATANLLTASGVRADEIVDTSLKASAIAPVDDAWRSKLPIDPAAATEAYMSRISPAGKARSNSYFEGGYWILLWRTAFAVLFSFILLQSGFSRRFRDWSERATRFRFLQVLLYAAVFLIATGLLGTPYSVYTDYFREHRYGLLNQTFFPWLKEELTGGAVGLVLGSLFVAILYVLIRKFPKTCHTWATAFSMVALSFGMFIAPVFIDPLFNRYEPLGPGPVRDRLLSMARGNGIPAKEILQFDASKQTDRISANVSGFGSTVAIRLNDNLLRRATPPEIASVMGHEMGHYVLNHLYKALAEFALIFFVLFSAVKWSFEKIAARAGPKWGVRSIGDSAGFPILVGLFAAYSFLLTPVLNSVVRSDEAEADLFGLNTAREPDANAEVDLKLTEYRKPDPGPIEEFIFFDHPSARSRILMAMRWKAENTPLK